MTNSSVFVADHCTSWPIVVVLVVGHFHKLAIVVGQSFRKLEIVVAAGPLPTVVVGVDGSPWAIPYGFGL